jgi:hypothetical protein
MIYFPFDNSPKTKDLVMFEVKNGEATGSLVPYMNGFVN